MDLASIKLDRGRFLKRVDDTHIRVQLVTGPMVVARAPSETDSAIEFEPGQTVELSCQPDNKNSDRWNVERIWIDKSWVGANQEAVSFLVSSSITSGEINLFSGYQTMQSDAVFENKDGKTTVDLKFKSIGNPDVYMDVRSVIRLDGDTVRYPNTKSQEDIQRLDGFEAIVESGARAVIFFAVNRPHGEWFEPAYDIDPEYANRLELAVAQGVEVVVGRVKHSPTGISIGAVTR